MSEEHLAEAGMHFERMAEEYADARPPYPASLYEALKAERVIGPRIQTGS